MGTILVRIKILSWQKQCFSIITQFKQVGGHLPLCPLISRGLLPVLVHHTRFVPIFLQFEDIRYITCQGIFPEYRTFPFFTNRSKMTLSQGRQGGGWVTKILILGDFHGIQRKQRGEEVGFENLEYLWMTLTRVHIREFFLFPSDDCALEQNGMIKTFQSLNFFPNLHLEIDLFRKSQFCSKI